jgi:hypothetical protein
MNVKDRLGDRRNELRFEIIGQLFGSLESVESLPLHNIGPGGALVESELALSPDAVYAVRLGLNGDTADIQATVRHVRLITSPTGTARYLVGLEFQGLSDAALGHIERIVAAQGGAVGNPQHG